MSVSSNKKEENDFEESDEEYPRGDFGSSKWSSTASSAASSVANETEPRQLETPKQELLDSDLVDYMIKHKDELTLDSIKAIHELLSELQLSQPGKDLNEHISELKTGYTAQCDTDYLRRELEEVKKSKRLLEMKFQISKKMHMEELKSIDNIKMDDLLKNNGAKDYIQSLKDRVKVKEESIVTLRGELDHQRKEVENLRERCTRSTKLSNHYFQLYKDSEAARVKLETVPERCMNNDRMLFVTSPANSIDDNHVPPPPPIDVPAIDEIMRSAKSSPLHSFNSHQPSHDIRYQSSANNSQYNNFSLLDNSIPPPPLDDVDLDEILGHISHSEQALSPPASLHNMSRYP